MRDVPKEVFAQMPYKGNIDLLNDRGERLCLRISRKATEEEIFHYSEKIAGFDGLVFRTFLSQGERACLQNLLYGKAKLVWIMPMAIQESIPVSWTDAFLENRAL